MHDPDNTRICMMQIHKNKSAAKLIKLLKITNALWINLSICSTVSVLQDFLKNICLLYSQKKRSYLLILCLLWFCLFDLLRTQEPEIGNGLEVIIYSGSIIIHVQDLIEKCVLLYHSRVLLLLNSYHHHSYK